jgi:cystathionine gamma-synthase
MSRTRRASSATSWSTATRASLSTSAFRRCARSLALACTPVRERKEADAEANHSNQLAAICEKKFGQPGELSILLPTHAKAEQCRAFLLAHSPTPIKPRIVHFAICASADGPPAPAEAAASLSPDVIDLQIVFFPGASWPLGKAFWQHAGEGISSRRADRCLELLGESIPGREDAQLEAQARIAAAEKAAVPAQPQAPVRPNSYSKNRHYSRGGAAAASTSLSRTSSPAGLSSTIAPQSAAQPPSQAQQLADEPAPDHSLYVEQRYGRNLPTGSAEIAKQALRRRIAGVLDADETATDGRRIGEEDVWLFPTGMSAIYNAHIACLTAWKGQEKMSSCFGCVGGLLSHQGPLPDC